MGSFNPVKIVKSVVDPVVDVVSDVGKGIADVGGDIIDNVDLEDAFTTYVATGGNPYAAAFAATDYDEDLGFNPAAFYDPASGGFSLTQPTGQTGDNTFGNIFGTAEGQIDLGQLGNIAGNIGLEYAKSEFMPSEGEVPEDTSIVFDEEGITRAALDYFFGQGPDQSYSSPSSFFNFGGIGIPALTTGLLTSGTLPFSTTDLTALGEFLKKYPVVPAGILAGLTYADRQRLNEQIEEGFAQYKGGKQAFAEKIASGQTRALPTRPLAKKGGIMSTRQGYMMGSEVPVRQNPQGVSEMDFRETGGFVPPIGIKEKADDIPAMLSNNEFVFTADAVRAAGGGSVNKGAEKMYALMKQLEGQA